MNKKCGNRGLCGATIGPEAIDQEFCSEQCRMDVTGEYKSDVICKYCHEKMNLEGDDYCCSNCGATHNDNFSSAWTEPTIEPENRKIVPEDKEITYPEEEEALDHLVKSWNAFIKLPVQHPDDLDEYRHSLHRLQHLIGMRKLRRIDPEKWYNELDKRF